MNSVNEIKELLQKNKKHLYKELQQSKEAVRLIKKSTHTSLSGEEKEKVKVRYWGRMACMIELILNENIIIFKF